MAKDKKIAKEDYYRVTTKIDKECSTLIYTDRSKIEGQVGAGAYIQPTESKELELSWNLGQNKEVPDAEAIALYKALEHIQKRLRTRNIYIFIDNQGVIKNLQKPPKSLIYQKNHNLLDDISRQGIKIYIQWIPGHENISGNEKADYLAKNGIKQILWEEDNFSTQSFLQRKIKAEALGKWEHIWKTYISKAVGNKSLYLQHCTPKVSWKNSKTKGERLLVSTYFQLKLGHGYFKTYLARLPSYTSNKCSCSRTVKQTPTHLILSCPLYKEERALLKLQGRIQDIQFYFQNEKGKELLLKYLKKTKIATRGWLLTSE